jgi:hypothetical protein
VCAIINHITELTYIKSNHKQRRRRGTRARDRSSNEEDVGYGGMFAQRRGSGEVGVEVLPPDVAKVIENSGAATEYHGPGRLSKT